MRFLQLCLIVSMASGAALADDGAGKSNAPAAASERLSNAVSARPLPPVLREPEPADSILVKLPGPPPAVPVAPPVASPEPVAKAVEPPAKVEPPPSLLDESDRPVLRRTAPKPMYPAGFEKDSAQYCQKLIGQWTLEDAVMLLGEARGSRPAFDDRHAQNGAIYAFADPTSRYRQIELDFDAQTGALRTVFGYPWSLTWQDCRRIWGANVSAAEANRGRKFYSYLNRRLDVLVDPAGKVISLGFY